MIGLSVHIIFFHIESFLVLLSGVDLPQDLRSILLSFLLSCSLALWRVRGYWDGYSKSCFCLSSVLSLFFLMKNNLPITYCENALSPPLSPIQLPEQPGTPPQALPVAPPPVVIPELIQPLLSDEARRDELYHRHSLLNIGGNDNLRRMVSIIDSQARVERYVEAALVDDGYSPHSILSKYPQIRGLLHSPQGELLQPRTYSGYITQIEQNGTRESVPYRRIMRAIRNYDLFLDLER